MPNADVPADQRRRLLLLADEVAGWHAELGSVRAQHELEQTLALLAHALVDLADGLPPRPRPAGPVRRRGGSRAAGVAAGPPDVDRAACSALAARLGALTREVTAVDEVPGPGACAVAATAVELARTLQEHAQLLAAGARPSPSALRWLPPRLEVAAEPLRHADGARVANRHGTARPRLR